MRRRWPLIAFSVVLASLMLAAACVQETPGDDPTPDDDTSELTPEPTPTPADEPAETPAPTPEVGDVEYELIASEKTLPPDLYMGVIEFADDPEGFEALWEHFGLEADLPDVDWDEQVVFFFGTGESGSCPLHLMDVTYDASDRLLTAEVSEDLGPDAVCTDDWTPRVFVIAVDAEDLEPGPLYARFSHPDRGPFTPGAEDDRVPVRE